jgi:hypothetical protein
MPTEEVKVKWVFVYADGRRQPMGGSIDRRNFSREEVERLWLHIQPEGTRIENLRAVDAKGKDLPADQQPVQFRPDTNTATAPLPEPSPE